jgi:ABC-type enterochelin transport system ATPase subunit
MDAKNKEREIIELREKIGVLTSQLKEEQNKRLSVELGVIRLSCDGIQKEMIDQLAHQWRQPLNVLALMIQNLQESWEFGVLDDSLVRLTTEQSMEQILSMSRSIDEFQRQIVPSAIS